jgi:hypothetical protein
MAEVYHIQAVLHVAGPEEERERVAERARSSILGQRIGGHFHIFAVEIDESKEKPDA